MKVKFLIQAAIIGAVYAAATMLPAPLSYGMFQVRFSEALTILPMFTPAAIPGLFVGCFVSNMISPNGLADMICGSLATLLAAYLSYTLKKYSWLVPLPPVVINGVVIGGMLYYVVGLPAGLLACMAWVTLGQVVACYGLGIPLMKFLGKHEKLFEV